MARMQIARISRDWMFLLVSQLGPKGRTRSRRKNETCAKRCSTEISMLSFQVIWSLIIRKLCHPNNYETWWKQWNVISRESKTCEYFIFPFWEISQIEFLESMNKFIKVDTFWENENKRSTWIHKTWRTFRSRWFSYFRVLDAEEWRRKECKKYAAREQNEEGVMRVIEGRGLWISQTFGAFLCRGCSNVQYVSSWDIHRGSSTQFGVVARPSFRCVSRITGARLRVSTAEISFSQPVKTGAFPRLCVCTFVFSFAEVKVGIIFTGRS